MNSKRVSVPAAAKTGRNVIVAAIGLAFLCRTATAEEGGSGHYLHGSMASFVDGVPLTETFIARLNLVYYQGSVGARRRLPIAGLTTLGASASSWAYGLTLLWRPPLELGGGWRDAMQADACSGAGTRSAWKIRTRRRARRWWSAGSRPARRSGWSHSRIRAMTRWMRLALGLGLGLACGPGCGKDEDPGPSCEKVADHVAEIATKAYPGHGEMMPAGSRKAYVASCQARKLTGKQRRCMLEAQSMEALAACMPRTKPDEKKPGVPLAPPAAPAPAAPAAPAPAPAAPAPAP